MSIQIFNMSFTVFFFILPVHPTYHLHHHDNFHRYRNDSHHNHQNMHHHFLHHKMRTKKMMMSLNVALFLFMFFFPYLKLILFSFPPTLNTILLLCHIPFCLFLFQRNISISKQKSNNDQENNSTLTI